MLLQEEPGPSSQYGCLMYGLRKEESATTGLIVQPTRTRTNGHICYFFTFSGFAWVYFVSSHAPPPSACTAFLQQSGQLILCIQDVYATTWMQQFAQKLKSLGRV